MSLLWFGMLANSVALLFIQNILSFCSYTLASILVNQGVVRFSWDSVIRTFKTDTKTGVEIARTDFFCVSSRDIVARARRRTNS